MSSCATMSCSGCLVLVVHFYCMALLMTIPGMRTRFSIVACRSCAALHQRLSGIGMPNAVRRCYYKTDLPHDPTDVHTQYAVELAQQARLFNVTLMPAIGIGGPDLQMGAAALSGRGEGMARMLSPHGVDVYQVSDEWATPHCAINIDYKTRFGTCLSALLH